MNILQFGWLATIITCFFQLNMTHNTNSLKYITEERRQWRRDLCDIAKRIEVSHGKQMKQALFELKMKLNPMGIRDGKILHDNHIWTLLEKMDKEPNDKSQKSLLLKYIQLLIKYDWEKTKREVTGNSDKRKMILAIIIGVIYIIYIHFIRCGNVFNQEYIMANFVIIMLPILLSSFSLKDFTQRKTTIILGILFCISNLLIVISLFSYYKIDYQYFMQENQFDIYFTVMIVLIIFIYGNNMKITNIEKKYVQEVEFYKNNITV